MPGPTAKAIVTNRPVAPVSAESVIRLHLPRDRAPRRGRPRLHEFRSAPRQSRRGPRA